MKYFAYPSGVPLHMDGGTSNQRSGHPPVCCAISTHAGGLAGSRHSLPTPAMWLDAPKLDNTGLTMCCSCGVLGDRLAHPFCANTPMAWAEVGVAVGGVLVGPIITTAHTQPCREITIQCLCASLRFLLEPSSFLSLSYPSCS